MKRLANTLLKPLGYELRRSSGGPHFRLTAGYGRRFAYFHSLLQMIDGVEGDIVECGVASGKSLFAQAVFLERNQPHRTIYGFDSFEGLPEISAEDDPDEYPEAKYKGKFANSMESVIARLVSSGIPEEYVDQKIRLVKGWLEDTLPGFDQPIALLHIDVDLYQSYLDVLENLYPKVSPGGIVAFDEYHDPLWVGASTAIHEFFGEDADIRESDVMPGKYYLVKE